MRTFLTAGMALLAAGTLCGCVTTYVPPTAGPRASFQTRFVQPLSGIVSVRTYKSPACDETMDLLSARIERDGSESKPVDIAANRPFTVRLGAAPDDNVCTVSVVFDPTEGSHYVAEYDRVGGKCFVRVMRSEGSGGASNQAVLEKSTRMNWPQCGRF